MWASALLITSRIHVVTSYWMMMALKTMVITCQLDVIDNNNSSDCADEAGTDMSRVLQTGLMGRHTDSSDLMDQRLPSTCLFSLSPSLFLLAHSLHPLPSVFHSSFCLHSLHFAVGSKTGLSAITSLFNWSINHINFSLSFAVREAGQWQLPLCKCTGLSAPLPFLSHNLLAPH